MKRRLLLPAFAAIFALGVFSARSDESTLPGQGFSNSRYEVLWARSPFAVASPEVAQDSPSYALIGLAKFDGVSYASLIDKQTQGHFLLSTSKPDFGFTLVSITPGEAGKGAMAVIQKNGQLITLQIESPVGSIASAPAVLASGLDPGQPMQMPGVMGSNLRLPQGASVPLVFRVTDRNEIKLKKQQQAIVDGLRQDFVNELGQNSNPNDPAYRQQWKKSQIYADGQLRAMLGDDIYSEFQNGGGH